MKLNLYINKLIRRIEKKIGKENTLNALGVSRKTVFCWKYHKYDLSVDQLKQVCILASEVLEEDMRMLFMDGLIQLTEDTMRQVNERKVNNGLL